MKILINSINYAPELVGIGKYTTEMSEWLAESGYDVKVITAHPYYPEWRIYDGYNSLLYRREKIGNTKIIRCPLWVPSVPTGLKRILHLSSFALTAMPIMIWQSVLWRPNIVFVMEPPFTCAPATLLCGKLASAQTWLHIQDFEIDAAFDLGIIRSGFIRRWVFRAESWILSRFNTVSTISTRMLEKLADKGVPEQNRLLFENWVETDKIYPMKKQTRLREELKLPDNKTIVLYSGNLGKKQGLEMVVQAAEVLQNRDDIHFILCGAGSSLQKLRAMSENLANFSLLSLQPVELLNDLLNLADIHILPQKPGAEDLVMPSKLTNMMASGRPVVATARRDTQIARVLESCGIVVEPGSLDEFCDAITGLADDGDLREQLGKNARKYVVDHWDKEHILEEMFSSCTLPTR